MGLLQLGKMRGTTPLFKLSRIRGGGIGGSAGRAVSTGSIGLFRCRA